MKVEQFLGAARDAMTIRRIIADPVTVDGTTVITVASVVGGGGAGEGHDNKGQEGEGGGFGARGRPVGTYVIKDGDVRWIPAVDVNRLVAALCALASAAVLAAASVMRSRNRAASPVMKRRV